LERAISKGSFMRRLAIVFISLLILALAIGAVGCGGEGTTTPTPTPTSDLTLGNVIFCSDVRESDDYDLQPDSTYVRGQVVFAYFDVYGALSKKEDGDFVMHLNVARLALFDSTGQEIGAREDVLDISRTSPYLTSSGSLWVYFDAPLIGPLGEYTMEIAIKDMLSGDTATANASFILKEGPLAIDHIRLCSEIRNVREYTIQPNSTYRLGDTIYVYFEIPGIGTGTIDGENEIWIKVSRLKLYDPQDRLVVNLADVLSQHIPYEPLIGAPYMWLYLDIGDDWTIGQYHAELTVEDGWTGETTTETFNFSVK